MSQTGDSNQHKTQNSTGLTVSCGKYPIAMNINGNPITLSLSGAQSGGNIGITGNSVVMAYGDNWQLGNMAS